MAEQNEIVAHQPAQAPAVQSETPNLMAVIARAAADPSVNVDKMERLLQMHERMVAQQAKADFAAAMVLMKPDLPVIGRRGRIEVRAKTSSGQRDGEIQQSTGYALWEDIDEALTPVLAKHGFALSFRSGVAQDGKITVTGILMHRGGHSEETTMTLPHDSSGSKNAVQAVGSSTSYGKRYTATLLLNIRTHGDDDDAVKGGAPETLTEEEIEKIFALLKKTGGNTDLFCKHMKIAGVQDIPRKDFGKALEAIESAAAARAKKASAGA